MGSHLIDGEFQSDKYPTTPRGKVPLSVRDTTAQDLLWEYAQRRRSVDAEFADDLESALRAAGYVGQRLAQDEPPRREPMIEELQAQVKEWHARYKQAAADVVIRDAEITRLKSSYRNMEANLRDARAQLMSNSVTLEKMRARKDAVYEERNRLVALFASMSIAMGWRAGIGTHEDKPGEDWDPEWKTLLVIETPEGQASWHFHDSQRHLVEHLPLFDAKWDGHDTPIKYERMNRLSRQLLLSNKLVARDAEIEHLREELREQSLTLEDAVARLDRVTEEREAAVVEAVVTRDEEITRLKANYRNIEANLRDARAQISTTTVTERTVVGLVASKGFAATGVFEQGDGVRHAAVSMVERPDGKLLCVWNRRYNGWSLPGGMVEKGETVLAAQSRELAEETGLTTLKAVSIFEGEHGLKAETAARTGRASIVHVFRVEAEGLAREMEDGCPVTWLSREEFVTQSPFGTFYVKVFAAIAEVGVIEEYDLALTKLVSVREDPVGWWRVDIGELKLSSFADPSMAVEYADKLREPIAKLLSGSCRLPQEESMVEQEHITSLRQLCQDLSERRSELLEIIATRDTEIAMLRAEVERLACSNPEVQRTSAWLSDWRNKAIRYEESIVLMCKEKAETEATIASMRPVVDAAVAYADQSYAEERSRPGETARHLVNAVRVYQARSKPAAGV